MLPPPTISKAENNPDRFFSFHRIWAIPIDLKTNNFKAEKNSSLPQKQKTKNKKKIAPQKTTRNDFRFFPEKKLGSNFSTPVLKFKNPGKMESTEVCLKKNCVNAARTSDPKSNKQNNKTISDILTEKNSKFVVLF